MPENTVFSIIVTIKSMSCFRKGNNSYRGLLVVISTALSRICARIREGEDSIKLMTVLLHDAGMPIFRSLRQSVRCVSHDRRRPPKLLMSWKAYVCSSYEALNVLEDPIMARIRSYAACLRSCILYRDMLTIRRPFEDIALPWKDRRLEVEMYRCFIFLQYPTHSHATGQRVSQRKALDPYSFLPIPIRTLIDD